MTYRTMAESYDFKMGLFARGYTPLTSHKQISKEVQEYAAQVKGDNIKFLESKIKSGARVSVSTDEYTAKNHKRYSAINVHNPDWLPIGIGMVRIVGSLDAELAEEKLRLKLSEFKISIDQHVVGTSTDGASVMVAMGDLLETLHQICFAHAIHLAVVDVIYKVSDDPLILLLAKTSFMCICLGQPPYLYSRLAKSN